MHARNHKHYRNEQTSQHSINCPDCHDLDRDVVSILTEVATDNWMDAPAGLSERLMKDIPKDERFSMRKLTFNLSIAASVLLVIGIGVYMLLHNEASAAQMLQRVIKNSVAYDGWVRITAQGESTDDSGNTSSVSFGGYLNPADGTEVFDIEMDGKRSIRMHIPSRQEMFEYDSESNEIMINAIPASQQPNGMEPTLSWLLETLRKITNNDDIITTRIREDSLDRYEILIPTAVRQDKKRHPGFEVRRVWVEPDTQRIRKMFLQGNGDSLMQEWSYGASPINNIYDLNVPRDAKVVDVRPEAHEARIAAQFELDGLRRELKRRYEAGFGDHTALIMESKGKPDIPQAPWYVYLLRKHGPYERMDSFYVGYNQEISQLRQYVVEAWPNLSFQQAFELEARGPVYSRFICDPNQVIISNKLGIHRQGANSNLGQLSMALITWKGYREIFQPNPYGHQTIDMTLLPIGSREEQWIGVRAIITGKVYKKKGVSTQQTTEEYWYDPLQDYVIMERSTTNDDNSPVVSINTTTLKVGQTPTGVYYPKHIQEKWKIRTKRSGKMEIIDQMREKHIILDTSLIPDEALFTEDQATINQ